MKTEIKIDEKLIAYCGLYCGACSKYVKGKCSGCAENEKATWCKIRLCNMGNNLKSCAECKEYCDLHDCKKVNNPFARLIEFFFNSNRYACIDMIRKDGYERFAKYMAENKLVSIKK
jgi:hypothetical protein